MKILATSDIHGNEEAVKKLANDAQKDGADLVIIAGDISDFDETPNGMIGPFLKKNKKVAFVMGNHESPGTDEFLVEKYKITNLQGYSFMVGDVGFFGCGGANIGINFMSEEQMHYYLAMGFKYIQKAKKKVMVTHVHPSGSKVEKFSFPGSAAVTHAIYQFKPDVHICGHIHEMEGFEEQIGKTKVVCVGARGKMIEV
ncbi:MAG TPA: metallophosphoesterase [archaeon]|nr:metallophosphoesterase [archaeon]